MSISAFDPLRPSRHEELHLRQIVLLATELSTAKDTKQTYEPDRPVKPKHPFSAVCGRRSVGKGFLQFLHSAGWCGHVSGLFMRPYHMPLAIMPFARPGSRSKARTQSAQRKMGFPGPAVSTGFVHSLLSALPNLRSALQRRLFLCCQRTRGNRFAITFAACHQCPDDACRFIGQRDRRDLC